MLKSLILLLFTVNVSYCYSSCSATYNKILSLYNMKLTAYRLVQSNFKVGRRLINKTAEKKIVKTTITDLLHSSLIYDLEAVEWDQTIIDFGAGNGSFAEDFINYMKSQFFLYQKPNIKAVVYKTNKRIDLKQKGYGEVIIGDILKSKLPSYSVGIGAYGPLSYTPYPRHFLIKALSKLKVNGSFYTVLDEKILNWENFLYKLNIDKSLDIDEYISPGLFISNGASPENQVFLWLNKIKGVDVQLEMDFLIQNKLEKLYHSLLNRSDTLYVKGNNFTYIH